MRDDETFRRVVIARLDSFASEPRQTTVRTRVVDGGEDVTMLRLLGGTDLDHGDEITVVVPDDAEK